MKIFLLIIITIFFINISSNDTNINIGFLFSKYSQILLKQTGFNLSGGVVSLALETINREHLLDGFKFNCFVEFDECIGFKSAGKTLSLIRSNKVSVLFGPTCVESSLRSTLVSKYFSIPSFIWGTASTANILNSLRFTSLFPLNYIFPTISYATLNLLKMFKWKDFAFVYATDVYNRCRFLKRDFQNVLNVVVFDGNLVFAHEISKPYSNYDYNFFLTSIKNRTRIIVSCFDNDLWKRKLMLAMYDNGMNTDEYVLIIMDVKNLGVYTNENDENGIRYKIYQNFLQADDKRDSEAYEVAKRTLFVDLPHFDISNPEYSNQILKRIKDWPFYCKECYNELYTRPAAYSSYLYDAILLWASILNKTLPIYGKSAINNASLYKQYCKGDYTGMTGIMKYTKRCLRMPIYILYGFDKLGNEKMYMNFTFYEYNKFTVNSFIDDPATTIFQNWGKQIPLNVPKCGYTNNLCPENIFEEYKTLVIIISITIGLFIISIFVVVFYIIRKVNINKEAELNKWMVNYVELSKNNSKLEVFGSQNNTNLASSNILNKNFDNSKFSLYVYMNRVVVGEKHNLRLPITKDIQMELNCILNFNYTGLNKYFGFCVDGPELLSVWSYCKRGNLFEFLQTDFKMFDTFFCMSLIKDLINGLLFLHNSPLEFHGTLTSKNCLISEHWQLKLSNFDFKELRRNKQINLMNKLWIAPEHLKNSEYVTSQKGDIYSLGIIISEIITRKKPWDFDNRKESLEELIYLICKGGINRPTFDLNIFAGLDIDSFIITVIKDCTSENINNRPTVHKISKLFTGIIKNESKNLMDHVFQLLEQHSSTLKKEIDYRSYELVEEQKKIDILLRRMLPKKVVECLKIGKTVEPESFASVTVFFSDIVKFTQLSAKCSAFQVVNLINELYSQFDSIIEKLDIYKVETIGDGYLCVSGLPERNGNLHGREIAILSLEFMKLCNNFSIPHLPNENIKIRIGCNTGPCVAGVVGLTMPRYCLFGDTINIASRMESNGKSGRIHITESCCQLLKELGGFIVESRGEIIIKGKGVMETFWLVGMIDGYNNNINHID
uniref:Guanylate cyclase n=1 Tax=Strongyloides papillosus TaxID=174720 RepID=A0A0N5B343_STREA